MRLDAFDGDKLYQQRARLVLPVLVRQAKLKSLNAENVQKLQKLSEDISRERKTQVENEIADVRKLSNSTVLKLHLDS